MNQDIPDNGQSQLLLNLCWRAAQPTKTNNLIADNNPQQYAFILSGYRPRMCLNRIIMQQVCGRSPNTVCLVFHSQVTGYCTNSYSIPTAAQHFL